MQGRQKEQEIPLKLIPLPPHEPNCPAAPSEEHVQEEEDQCVIDFSRFNFGDGWKFPRSLIPFLSIAKGGSTTPRTVAVAMERNQMR